MGKIQIMAARNSELHITISRALHQRVADAAKRTEQSLTGWVRLAIVEKLERDESR